MRFKLLKNIKVGLLSMLLPLFAFAEVHANTKDVHNIIDICTSSEHIMRDYALIGMRITYSNPQKDLEKTQKHLNEEFKDLEKHKVSAEELILHKEWSSIEEELKQKPTKEGTLTLHHHIDAFAQHCEELAEHLAKDTKNPAEHYVVMITNLNLNVQELAEIYIMKSWDSIGDEEYFKKVKEIFKNVLKSYDELQTADSKFVSDKVKGHLKIMKKHFMMFEFMAESHSGRYIPLLITKKAEKISEEVEKILKEEESEVEK